MAHEAIFRLFFPFYQKGKILNLSHSELYLTVWPRIQLPKLIKIIQMIWKISWNWRSWSFHFGPISKEWASLNLINTKHNFRVLLNLENKTKWIELLRCLLANVQFHVHPDWAQFSIYTYAYTHNFHLKLFNLQYVAVHFSQRGTNVKTEPSFNWK